MSEDRERLRQLRTILAEAGFDWDLVGDPPEIPAGEAWRDLLRKTIVEIQRDFPATLAAIAAGKVEAPRLPEHEAEFLKLSEKLLELGVFFDGTGDPPDLAEVAFDLPKDRKLAERTLAEMLARFPNTIARIRADGFSTPASFFDASPLRNPPPRPLGPLKDKN